jgi:hypothetical protein
MEALNGRCNEVLQKGEVARAWEGKSQGLQVIENEWITKRPVLRDAQCDRMEYQVDIPTFSLRVSVVIIDQGKAAIKSESGRCSTV